MFDDTRLMFPSEDDENFGRTWKSIISGEELVCKQTGTRYSPLPKPKAIVIDVSISTFFAELVRINVICI